MTGVSSRDGNLLVGEAAAYEITAIENFRDGLMIIREESNKMEVQFRVLDVTRNQMGSLCFYKVGEEFNGTCRKQIHEQSKVVRKLTLLKLLGCQLLIRYRANYNKY